MFFSEIHSPVIDIAEKRRTSYRVTANISRRLNFCIERESPPMRQTFDSSVDFNSLVLISEEINTRRGGSVFARNCEFINNDVSIPMWHQVDSEDI